MSPYECDEYPYASTNQGGLGAWAACIPFGQNNAQGGRLTNWYKGKHAGFQVSPSILQLIIIDNFGEPLLFSDFIKNSVTSVLL